MLRDWALMEYVYNTKSHQIMTDLSSVVSMYANKNNKMDPLQINKKAHKSIYIHTYIYVYIYTERVIKFGEVIISITASATLIVA
jgi:hypothetical protein